MGGNRVATQTTGRQGSRSTRVEDRVRRRRRTGQSRFNWPCSSIARLIEPESFVANDAGAVACDREGCIGCLPAARPRLEAAVREQVARVGPCQGRQREREDGKTERRARCFAERPCTRSPQSLRLRLL